MRLLTIAAFGAALLFVGVALLSLAVPACVGPVPPPGVAETEARMGREVRRLHSLRGPDGRFLRPGTQVQDSWGRTLHVEYRAAENEEAVILRSAGPEGRFHTGDDILKILHSAEK